MFKSWLHFVLDTVTMCILFFFSSRRRHTRCALVTGVQTCALPILTIRMHRAFLRDRLDPLVKRHTGRPMASPTFVYRRTDGSVRIVRGALPDDQIGRASCRERVCQYV